MHHSMQVTTATAICRAVVLLLLKKGISICGRQVLVDIKAVSLSCLWCILVGLVLRGGWRLFNSSVSLLPCPSTELPSTEDSQPLSKARYLQAWLFGFSLLCLRPHRAEALSDSFVWRLSVWRLSRTSGLNREQRGLGRLKLAQR